MRESWKEITIGDLGKVVTGNTPPKNDKDNYGGSYPFIKPTDMEVGRRYVTTWEENYSEKAFKKYKNSYIPPKATGVVTIGTVGEKMFQADQWCFTNQSVNVIIPNTELYDEDFIFYLMKINLPKVENANPGTASGRHHVSKSNFCAIKICVPGNKETQRKIANILSGYDDLIENNLKRIKILEEMAQQTYEEWFVRMRFPGYETAVFDENGLPEGWSIAKLRDVLVLNYGKALKQEVRIEGEFNVYGSSGVVGTHIDYLVKGPGLIIGRKGNVGSVHFENNNFYPIDTVYYATSELSLKYLYYLIKSLTFVNNDAAVPGLNRDAAYNKEIIKPIHTLIKKFDDYCAPLYVIKENLQSQNKHLRETRDILLPRLMMGIIDVESLETKPIEAKIIPLEQPKKEAPKEFKEAVLIACLTERFGSEKFPLGRKRYTKLSYLFHRYSDNKIQDYLRKAAGPYNPKTKYGGPEKIALNSKYIQNWKGDKGTTGFVVAEKIDDAKKYFSNYWQIADLDWLVTKFKFKSNDELELLATVDNSLIELSKKNIEFTSTNVLDIIKSEKEWEAKLERTIFSDANVESAISFLIETLQYEK
ncbi:restriction endonuclease subunit S [Chryseobacterium cucumeris]|uniref:restriction endonuclease subunit S n=1 Tax=Chryseobacterium cucumeris TaxID=1813611 RepID=UPI0007EFDE39|nr:restriction endonuclease subunit S [Chryseobacterium cucumeris]